jgi:hypothetical protein
MIVPTDSSKSECSQRYHSTVEAEMDAGRSNHAWSTDCVPAPTPFVKRSPQNKVASICGARSNNDEFISASQPTTAALGNDMWSFMAAASYKRNDVKYYAAHRRHIAEEVASCVAKGCKNESKDWDAVMETSLFFMDD